MLEQRVPKPKELEKPPLTLVEALQLAKDYIKLYTRLINEYSKGKIDQKGFVTFMKQNKQLQAVVMADLEIARQLHDQLNLSTLEYGAKGNVVRATTVRFESDLSKIRAMNGALALKTAKSPSEYKLFSYELIGGLRQYAEAERERARILAADPNKSISKYAKNAEENYMNARTQLFKAEKDFVTELAKDNPNLKGMLSKFYQEYSKMSDEQDRGVRIVMLKDALVKEHNRLNRNYDAAKSDREKGGYRNEQRPAAEIYLALFGGLPPEGIDLTKEIARVNKERKGATGTG
jgi:hypothetical protein